MSYLKHLENHAAFLQSAFIQASDEAFYAQLAAEAAAEALSHSYDSEERQAVAKQIAKAAEAAEAAKEEAFQNLKAALADVAQEVREVRDLANALARSNWPTARAARTSCAAADYIRTR